MDKEIQELFETLNIATKDEDAYSKAYEISTPFEKCGITINIPTTVGSSTIIQTK
ncbi:MAG: hypothetical protein LBC58_04625 [Clostridiales Family XIII bacterium]|nr:hypothetical protein [Clostridiales Family XIII bacterium]